MPISIVTTDELLEICSKGSDNQASGFTGYRIGGLSSPSNPERTYSLSHSSNACPGDIYCRIVILKPPKALEHQISSDRHFDKATSTTDEGPIKALHRSRCLQLMFAPISHFGPKIAKENRILPHIIILKLAITHLIWSSTKIYLRKATMESFQKGSLDTRVDLYERGEAWKKPWGNQLSSQPVSHQPWKIPSIPV